MKKSFYILWIILFCVALFAQPLVAQQRFVTSLFSDKRGQGVGDIITVLIVETSSAKSEANSSNSKSSDHGFSSTGGKKSQSFMPLFGLRGQLDNGFDNDAATSRSGSLKGKITAAITDVNERGNFIISGTREMVVNGETEKITISGVVRPEDISTDNTVYSFQIADAKISYKGKGLVDKGQKPGLVDKILGFLF
jgi:flagellar L-ring protein precursor FlgH